MTAIKKTPAAQAQGIPKNAVRRRVALAKMDKAAREAVRKRRRFLFGVAAGLVGLQVFSPATLVVLLLGMVPSVVSYLADVDARKRSAHCMAVLNLAGVVPVLTWLWEAGGSRAAAANLLSDPFVWLLMYGSAGLAALLVAGLPVLVGHVFALRNAKQANTLEKELLRLEEEWGSGITFPSETS